MKPGFVIVDGNSLGYLHHNGPKLRAKNRETQAVFGFVRSMGDLAIRYPRHTIVVLWDGHAQWRYDLLPPTADHCGYKGERDKDPKTAAMRAAYKEIRPEIHEALRLLGIRQMTCPTAEADDLAAFLVAKAESEGRSNILHTGDGDWRQLVSDKTELYDIRTGDRIRLSNFFDLTGYRTPRAFVEGKCLMGDGSDKVPGVGMIGEDRAALVLAEYGSVAKLLTVAKTADTSKWPKYLRDFVTNAKGGIPAFKRNLQLMDLSRAQRPAAGSIVVDRGTPDKEALREFCQARWFESFLLDFDAFTRPFPALRNTTQGVPA